jgi:hypothetical protein
MLFLPAKDEFLIFPFSKEYARRQLKDELALSSSDKNKKFVGWIEGENFRICKKLSRPDNFSPVLKGTIDASSKGIIIVIKYRLMFSTKMFLLFWSLLLLFLSLFFILQYNAILYGIIALAMGIINYLIVYINFRKQVKVSHDLFINVLDPQS